MRYIQRFIVVSAITAAAANLLVVHSAALVASVFWTG
jgi:hypothetical protein